MAVDMFMKIDDIKGESIDAKHKDEIDVLSWTWGVTQSGTSHTGSGGGAGKVQVSDLTFTKRIDKATPILIKNSCSGKHMKSAVLVVRRAGGQPLEYLTITMEDLLVSAVTTGGSSGDDTLTENVTLNFARVKLEYVPQKAGGGGDASIPMGWNIAANKEI